MYTGSGAFSCRWIGSSRPYARVSPGEPGPFLLGSFDLAVTPKGVPIPLAAAIFTPIELALVLQSRQFALRAPANRSGPAKALS